MSLNNAKNILDILIRNSECHEKEAYIKLRELINNNVIYTITSKEIQNLTSLKPTFIRNFSNMLNSKRGEESHIRLYITKNGSMSLLNIAKMSYPTEGIISHYNSCYSEIEGIDHD